MEEDFTLPSMVMVLVIPMPMAHLAVVWDGMEVMVVNLNKNYHRIDNQ
jgi:hypothetical protein